jgi:peptidoglycan/xylan/chitin deacetylase (PgdA/CDA1 family)
MTVFVSAYDLEAEPKRSLPAAEAVARVHRKHELPATFFIVARLLEIAGREYRRILDDPLFDIQCHSYSHAQLKPVAGSPVEQSEALLDREIGLACRIVADTFGQTPIGFTTPGGFTHGLRGEKRVLEKLWNTGIRFVRSDARGPRETIPAPITQPYTYAAEGFPELWELPPHDWHDNVLTGQTTGIAAAWPPVLPWGLPPNSPRDTREWFEVYRKGVDWAATHDMVHYMPTFHPWSVWGFDRATGLDRLLGYVKGTGLEVVTCAELYRRLSDGVSR